MIKAQFHNDFGGQRSIHNLIFMAQLWPSQFLDWFWKVIKSINNVFMQFSMFDQNFGHDL